MLIINTAARQLGKHRKIQLYVDGLLVDELNPNEIKKYNLVPGEHSIALKMNFYRSPEQIIDVKSNSETHAFEMRFREDWKYLLFMLVFAAIGIGIDYWLRQAFASTPNINLYVNGFIVVYFVVLFMSNVWVNKSKYLRLVPIDKK